MCSNADVEHDGITLMEKVELDQIGKICKKCGEKSQAKVVLRKKDAYCKLCFLSSVTHKFRACLGKSKTMRPGDKVLIAFSGSDNSIALLHLIQTGLRETSHKRLMFEPCVVYIDEGTALNLSSEERIKIREDISKVLEMFEYPSFIVPLELSSETEEGVHSYLDGESCSPDTTALTDLFGAVADITSKIDILTKLRHNLLARVAKYMRCNKVFTAETANDLAVKLLTNVSLGRGAQLPFDVGFLDSRFPEVKIVRPLRDLSKKELVFYNIFHSLTSVHVPSLLTKSDPHSSIHRLTESFLCDLQDGFPSTLSTVFRVADKLTTNSEDKDICPLCKAPLEMEETASSSFNATQFSRLVSSSGPSNFDSVSLTEINLDSSSCGRNESSNTTCNGSCSSESLEEKLQQILCYGCNLILKDADINRIPAPIIKHLQESSQRSKMRKEIEEFLL